MSNLSDVVGNAGFINGANYTFVPNRFCNPNSAIYLNFGYLQAPTNVYFSGDFTITGWINIIYSQQFTYSSILSFSNGQSNTVYVKLLTDKHLYRLFGYTQNGVVSTDYILNQKTWYHLSIVQINTNGKIYINGQRIRTENLASPDNINRTTNYIGKNDDPALRLNLNAILSDLKIYKGALSDDQVLNDYLTSSNNGTFIILN